MGDGEDKTALVKGTIEAATGLVREIPLYQDAVQPAAKEAGQLLTVPLSVVNTALRPIRTLLLAANLSFDRLDAEVRKRLAGIREDKIVEPRPNLAGPLLMAYPFVQDEPQLRELFEDLLATAMNSETRDVAHPSFVEVIKQLTSDEAQIIRQFAKMGVEDFPIIRLDILKPSVEVPGDSSYQTAGNAFDFGDLLITSNVDAAVSNVERLGIIYVTHLEAIADNARYARLESLPVTSEVRELARLRDMGFRAQRGVVRLTAYGGAFIRACVDARFGKESPPDDRAT